MAGAFIEPYRGYRGSFNHHHHEKLIYGRVIGLKDVVTFQGATIKEARQAFEESVDDYLAFCKERGEEPERPDYA